MNHAIRIQQEFVKEARKWDDLTYDEQKGYLKRHPKSKRKITAKPGKSAPSKRKRQETEKTVKPKKQKTIKPKLSEEEMDAAGAWFGFENLGLSGMYGTDEKVTEYFKNKDWQGLQNYVNNQLGSLAETDEMYDGMEKEIRSWQKAMHKDKRTIDMWMEELEKRDPGSSQDRLDTAMTEKQKALKEKAEARRKQKEVHKQREEQAIPKTFPDTPALDKHLGKLYSKYAVLFEAHGPMSKQKDGSPVIDKINNIWSKMFPDSKSQGEYAIDDVETRLGLAVDRMSRQSKEKGKPPRKTLPSKEEFVDAVKDSFIDNSNSLPKIDGDKDVLAAENKKYGLRGPLSGMERTQLHSLEESLPGFQKQFAKHLIVTDRFLLPDDDGHDWNVRNELVDTSGDRPIIKHTYSNRNYKDERDTTSFLVPTSSRYAVKNFDRGAGDLDYGRFNSIEEAKAAIASLPEQEKKAGLREEIGGLNKKLGKIYEDTIKPGYSDNSPISSHDINSIARAMIEAPREDQYSTEFDTNGKEIGKKLWKKGREFLLSKDEQKDVVTALSYPGSLSIDRLKKAKENLEYFVEDLKNSQDLVSDYNKKYYPRFISRLKKHESVIDKAMPIVALRDKLSDQHGHQTKEDIILPKGFKFVDEQQLGHGYEDADIKIVSDDGDIEIAMTSSAPGHAEYSPIYGEIWYKVPGKDGTYVVGRHGVDSGIYGDWNDDINDIVKESIDLVREKQDYISKAKSVPIGKGSWSVSQERIDEMKRDLNNGKTVSFMPHGFGTGYTIRKRPGGEPMTETEKIFGVPLSIRSFDAD